MHTFGISAASPTPVKEAAFGRQPLFVDFFIEAGEEENIAKACIIIYKYALNV